MGGDIVMKIYRNVIRSTRCPAQEMPVTIDLDRTFDSRDLSQMYSKSALVTITPSTIEIVVTDRHDRLLDRWLDHPEAIPTYLRDYLLLWCCRSALQRSTMLWCSGDHVGRLVIENPPNIAHVVDQDQPLRRQKYVNDVLDKLYSDDERSCLIKRSRNVAFDGELAVLGFVIDCLNGQATMTGLAGMAWVGHLSLGPSAKLHQRKMDMIRGPSLSWYSYQVYETCLQLLIRNVGNQGTIEIIDAFLLMAAVRFDSLVETFTRRHPNRKSPTLLGMVDHPDGSNVIVDWLGSRAAAEERYYRYRQQKLGLLAVDPSHNSHDSIMGRLRLFWRKLLDWLSQ